MAASASAPVLRRKRPWYRPLGLVKRFAFSAALVYIGICVYLYSIQTQLVYPGSTDVLSTDRAIQEDSAFKLVPWDHTMPGATAPQGYVRTDFAAPAPRGTIVLFHGNGGWAAQRAYYLDALDRRGFRVFLYEYPGYGGRPGRPSEATIVPDSQALIRSLDQSGYGPVYIWGESLGAGVAAAVCADATLPVHGLVLITPWDNIANVGLSIYPWIPVRQLMTDKYDSIAKLEHFQHPVCVIRSDHDEIIPPPLTLNLFEHLPEPKKMIVQKDSGHNTWPNSPDLAWWDEALDFTAPK